MPQISARPDWLEDSTRKDGRYVIGPLLGHGGMGDVHQAWDSILGRVVALKILTQAEPAAMVRFMHEAQLQAMLEHPNICRIYDIEAHDGVPRIAMQLVRGPTLEDATDDLELETIVAVIAQVAETLLYAHRNGLIHRDVKPGNIILEPREDGSWKPVICDFGLALALDHSVLTLPNALTGTPAYMAPEQVRGDRRLVGPATDVYGLGGTLYFLLVRRPPCVSTATQEMLRVKKEKRFPRPRSLEPAIPEQLEAILLRCLAPDPADRYPSMGLLAEDLWAFLGRAEPRRPRRRRWGRAAAAAAAALALAGALGGLAWRRTGAHLRWAEMASRARLEAGNLEQGLLHERQMPLHDTRGALARIRAAKEATLRESGDEAAWALVRGTANICLGDLTSARADLEKAWGLGLTTPETAYQLGIVCCRQWLDQDPDALRLSRPAPADSQSQARGWFQRARGLSRDREEYARALEAALALDLPRALEHARSSEKANPWRWEPATLGTRCLIRMARDFQSGGDAGRAAQAYREALQWAEEGVRQAPSDGALRHAALVAGLGLAGLKRTRGLLTSGMVDQLQARAQEALTLDPEAALAQTDWLSVQCLEVLARMDRGQDPGPTLARAETFRRTRTQASGSPALRAAHLMLDGLAEARERTRRGRPTPARASFQDPGTAGDCLPDLLLLKTGLGATPVGEARRRPSGGA